MRLLAFISFYLVSVSCFGQQSGHRFVSTDTVINIAKNNGPFNSSKKWHQAWTTNKPQLDTAKAIWELTSSKVKSRGWGKTTKNFDSDFRRPCRRVNGCRVHKTKTILIDANTGRILSMK